MCCYKALMGRDTPCEGCPCQKILEKKTDSKVLYNERDDVFTDTEATLVRWGGKQACMMTSHRRNADTI